MPSIVYGVCAAVAGTILGVQMLMSLLGFDGDLDGDLDVDAHFDGHDHGGESHSFFGVLSFRTVTAALTFFGLAGLGGEQSGWDSNQTLAVAVVAGAFALYGTYWLGVGLNKLQSDATADPQDAIGCTGNVYLRIPAARAGAGKVQVSQQGRTIEYEAVTSGAELATGESVVVVAFVAGDTVEVEAAATR
jgi:hypothetical protein